MPKIIDFDNMFGINIFDSDIEKETSLFRSDMNFAYKNGGVITRLILDEIQYIMNKIRKECTITMHGSLAKRINGEFELEPNLIIDTDVILASSEKSILPYWSVKNSYHLYDQLMYSDYGVGCKIKMFFGNYHTKIYNFQPSIIKKFCLAYCGIEEDEFRFDDLSTRVRQVDVNDFFAKLIGIQEDIVSSVKEEVITKNNCAAIYSNCDILQRIPKEDADHIFEVQLTFRKNPIHHNMVF